MKSSCVIDSDLDYEILKIHSIQSIEEPQASFTNILEGNDRSRFAVKSNSLLGNEVRDLQR